MKKEKIFITGGAGFIGSHITESLVKDGHRVRAYDNFSSGRMDYLKNIKDDVEVIKGDILDYHKLEKAMRGCDFISHQAAQLEIFHCLADPKWDLEINSLGTLNVLKAAVKNRVKKIINASSACVYGQAQYTPEDESHPKNPNWPYGVSKLAAEKYCQIYGNNYGIPVVSLRYGIVYGEREWQGRVLTMFIRRMLENKPPVIFGGGSQLRDFVYVGDVVKMHNLCFRLGKGEIFNVSTAQGTSIKELAKVVIGVSGKDFRPVFEDLREGRASKFMPQRKRIPQELKKMVLSADKAREVLGWQAAMPLAQGIKKEIEWIRENPKAWKMTGQIKV